MDLNSTTAVGNGSDLTETALRYMSTWDLTEEQLLAARINNIMYYSFMLPVAICGNIFTLTAVIMVLKLKSSIPNLLIVVLACTDLFSILTCHIITIASMAKGEYIGSHTLCQFQSMMTYSYFKMGFLTKCCISLDRFIALAFPLRYRKLVTMKKVLAVIIHNVLFSFGTSAVTLIVDGELITSLPTWYLCVNEFEIYTKYKLAICVGEGAIFTLGVILFFISNITVIKVVMKLNRKSKEMLPMGVVLEKRQSTTLTTESNTDTDNNNDSQLASISGNEPPYKKEDVTTNLNNTFALHDFNNLERNSSIKSSTKLKPSNPTKSRIIEDRRKQNRQRKELQLAKLVTIIVTVFVILWMPYMTVIYWEHNNQKAVHPFVEDIVIKLVFANCCINPILYGVFNANFRKAYIYYLRLLGFYFTCKMTKRPQDIRKNDATYNFFEKGRMSAKLRRQLRKYSQDDTTLSIIPNTETDQPHHLSNYNTMSGPVTAPPADTIKQLFKEFREENEDMQSTEVDQSILKLAIQNLYSVPDDTTPNDVTSNIQCIDL